MPLLNGWKQIANYMGRGVRTVQRWESLGLPIRRPRNHNRSAVLAVSEDLDAWVQGLQTTAPGGTDEIADLKLRIDRLRELENVLSARQINYERPQNR